MDEASDVEELETRCWRLLAEVTDQQVLERICTAFALEIPAAAVGKRNILYKVIIKYLNSDTVQDHRFSHTCT